MELVSIVITTYNRNSKFLKAIKSVMAQDYPFIEIIVINDYPYNDDELVNTINQLKKQTQFKIKYKKNKVNLGAPGARNAGINMSEGEYIGFLDDDDQFYVSKISKQVEFLKNTNYDFCYVFSKIYRNGKLRKIVKNKINDKNQLEQMILKTYGGTSSLLFRKRVFKKILGFKDLPCGQEWELQCRALKNGFTVGYVNGIYMKTEEDSTEISITSQKNIEKVKELYKYKFYYAKDLSNKKIYKKLMMDYNYQKAFYQFKENRKVSELFLIFDIKNISQSVILILKAIVKVYLGYD